MVLRMLLWANVSFLGFPLASNAFGPAGLTYAAILNAQAMPAFITLGIILLHVVLSPRAIKTEKVREKVSGESTGIAQMTAQRPRQAQALGKHPLTVITNPVIVAVALGIVISALRTTGVVCRVTTAPAIAPLVATSVSILETLAQMGPPLALPAVGSALHLDSLRGTIPLLGGL